MRKHVLLFLLLLVWLLPLAETVACSSNVAITSGFKTSQWYSKVRTGDFDLGEMITGGKKPPTHHDNMNMDLPDTEMGKQNICPTCNDTYFAVAKNAAIRHTKKILTR